ncbi:MAG: glycoside hydrolase N-terminal domain-containing protein [Phycisphaerae bacterium]|nr:glycoside hydrolase N-terminal domain-containing protein [Phycisphaerae bacterium]
MLIFLLSLFASSLYADQVPNCDSLWYQQPPTKWDDAFPMGNGRLGMVVYGTADEYIIFNEDSIWSGWSEKNNDREGSFAALQKIRKLLKEDAPPAEINKIAMDDFCSLHGYGKPDFGAYQSFFNAHIDFGHDQEDISNYRRRLDLSTAVADITYVYNNVNYQREYFSSYPGQVSVMRFTADKTGSIDLLFSLSSLHKKTSVIVKDNTLFLDGQVDTGVVGQDGMKFQAQIQFQIKGGKISQTEVVSEIPVGKNKIVYPAPAIKIEDADEVVVIMAGATNYKLQWPDYTGGDPSDKNAKVLNAIKGKSYEDLISEHIKDYKNLFDSVKLEIAGTDRSDLPTDTRRKEYKKTVDDPALEVLVFHFGRYLMISSSRPGGLPANLQGLWNNTNSPPWLGDYHLNINLQMNYWPVDLCNLSECMEPLTDWLLDLQKPGAKTAKIHYNSRGWVAHHSANIWGFTSPGPNRGVHMLEAESAAFICQNVWDHYAYTADKDYLKNQAWPLLKGAAQFWVDSLQEVDGGYLAVVPAFSPEHGPLTDSAYFQVMVVWDLFSNCIKASEILDIDHEFANQLKIMRERLMPLQIGEYGQLQEWRDQNLEKNVKTDKHRHFSHLYAVYPGKQIITGKDPKFTKAAIQSMNFRGDGATGWSMGWKVNTWARLLDGNRAHKLASTFVSSRVSDALWCLHPPFQIDGNFGYTSGIAELLLQSHIPLKADGAFYEIHLLPALPDKWASGSIKGLKARGGVLIDHMSWENKELKNIQVKANTTGKYTFVYKDRKFEVQLKKNAIVSLNKYLIN